MSILFLKIWSLDRHQKTVVHVTESGGHDLVNDVILKASEKMQKNGSSLVLESDGTPLDEDIILKHFKDEIIILLEANEQWHQKIISAPSTSSNLSSSSTLTQKSMLLDFDETLDNIDENSDANTSISVCDLDLENTEPTTGAKKEPFVHSDKNNVEIIQPASITYQINCNSNFLWQMFEVDWTQFPSHIISECEKGTRDRNTINFIIHTVVNKMREIKKELPSSAIKIVTKKLIDKFPETFKDVDEDGILIGDGSHSIFKKILDRNNYLNRPHKRKMPVNTDVQGNKRLNMSRRAGCSNWAPALEPKILEEDDSKNIDSQSAKENRDDQNYALQRQFLNSIPSVKSIKENWPILLTEQGAKLHFKKLTGSDVSALTKCANEKFEKIVKLDKNNGKGFSNMNSKLMMVLQIVASYFKEDFEYIVLDKSSNAHSDSGEIEVDMLQPVLIKKDNDGKEQYDIYYEKELIIKDINIDSGLEMIFALYFNFNLKYPEKISLTFEFVQRYFVKIHPDSGSKCAKYKRVINLLNKLRNL